MKTRLVPKVYSFVVDAQNTLFNKKFDLDKNAKLVRGIILSSDQPNKLFYRGSQRIEISGDEIFPEDFESKMLMSGMAVAPNKKYCSLGNAVIAGNLEFKIQYKDSHNPYASFEPYKVIITVRCEMK